MNEGTRREGKEEERNVTDSAACVVSAYVGTRLLFAVNAPTARDRVLELGRNVLGGCLNVVRPQLRGWGQWKADYVEKCT